MLSPAGPLAAVRTGRRYDLIDLSADFLDAAEANATAFSVEALAADLAALAPDGLVSIPVSIRDFPTYASRMLATVRAALLAAGARRSGAPRAWSTARPGTCASWSRRRYGTRRASPRSAASATTARSTSRGIPASTSRRRGRNCTTTCPRCRSPRAPPTRPARTTPSPTRRRRCWTPSRRRRGRCSTWRRSRSTGRSSMPCCGSISSAPCCAGWRCCRSRRSPAWSTWRCWRRRRCWRCWCCWCRWPRRAGSATGQGACCARSSISRRSASGSCSSRST